MVYVAVDAELNREVALKEIQPGTPTTPTAGPRFLLEAEVTGRLEHPGIVPVYGLGHDADGRPFYAMRFIRGESLKEAIDRFHAAEQPPAATPASGRWRCGSCWAGSSTSATRSPTPTAGACIHRDLKPANIMLGPYGETLVVDWGLAKVVGRDEPTPRRADRGDAAAGAGSGSAPRRSPAAAMGTPAYMSPEQAGGRARPAGPGQRRLQPGGDALLPADRPAAVRGRRRRRASCGGCGGASSRRRGRSTPRGARRRWRRSA